MRIRDVDVDADAADVNDGGGNAHDGGDDARDGRLDVFGVDLADELLVGLRVAWSSTVRQALKRAVEATGRGSLQTAQVWRSGVRASGVGLRTESREAEGAPS